MRKRIIWNEIECSVTKQNSSKKIRRKKEKRDQQMWREKLFPLNF